LQLHPGKSDADEMPRRQVTESYSRARVSESCGRLFRAITAPISIPIRSAIHKYGTFGFPIAAIEIVDHHDCSQVFGIAWIPTYFGKARAVFVCSSCRGGAIRLFGKDGNYACRFCHRAQYLSQKQKTASRKRLAACKLRLELGGWPDIHEAMSSKPKWTRRRTCQRIRHRIRALEVEAKRTRFRKEIDIRTFSYHVASSK
jgi:hypothetical protein